MRIKQLEIHGFKSFVDRTTFRFGEGISGIVGPNGCGKSNVLDAIKWVLGEQNPRTLRGQSMADIIFAGSDRRSPVGLAEVSLTLTNAHGPFAGAWAALTELQVTRRLFRSGDSEYQINRLQVRLRDIHDLFLDTGVGLKAYSIIEQGRIGQIVSAKPEERRHIIEEAAGISRYKVRREEALRQLAATTQNLERLNDVLAELKKQMGTLERQARKAEVYLQIRTELSRTELVIFLLRYGTLSNDEQQINLRGQVLLEREQALLKALEAAEAALEKTRARLGDEGRQLGQLKDHVARDEGAVNLADNTLEHQSRQLETLKNRFEELANDLNTVQGRQQTTAAANQNANQHITLLTEKIAVCDADIAGEELRVAELSSQKSEASRQHESGRSAIVGHLTAVARLRNNLANLERRIEDISHRLERNKDEESRLQLRLEELETNHSQQESRLEGINRDRESTKEAREELQDEAGKLKGDVKRLDDACHRAKDDLTHKRSRLKSLKELENNLEGYGSGVKMVVREYRGAGVVGPLVERIDIPREYEAATEAALGDRLQAILVQTQEHGLDAADFLKATSGGRATFLPLNLPEPATAAAPTGEGILGPLSSLVKTSSEVAPLIRALLQRRILVRSLDDARKLVARAPSTPSIADFTWVTLAGDLVEASGVVSGGSASDSGGLLRKKGEIRELGTEVTRLDRYLIGQQEELERLKERQESVTAQLEALRERLHQQDLAAIDAEKDLKQTVVEVAREKSSLRLKGLDARSLGAQLDELHREAGDARHRLEEEEGARTLREEELEALAQEVKRLTDNLDAAKSNLTAFRIHLTGAQKEREEAERTVQRLTGELRELLENESRISKQAGESRTERLLLEHAREKVQQELEAARTSLQQGREALERVSKQYGDVRRILTEQETLLTTTRKEYTDVSRELSQTVLQAQEIKLQLEHLLNTVAEKFQGPLEPLACLLGGAASPLEAEAAVLSPQTILQVPGAEPKSSITLEAGVLATVRTAFEQAIQLGGSRAIPALEDDAASLRARLARLGEVNLAAVEEFRELEQRYNFSKGQEEDLQQSVTSIKNAINRINRTSRERFRQTFDAVNGHFQTIFPKLFSGGMGKLILTNEEDLLETGVDIVVRPPGKKLQNMNLLSGGEKAMTAVALIFAIFMVRPSPFCILDEVDAPLDEANTGRFQEVIRELSALSQFIVITHNKRTMEAADTLYGVTMPEPGVSRLVTVDLAKELLVNPEEAPGMSPEISPEI